MHASHPRKAFRPARSASSSIVWAGEPWRLDAINQTQIADRPHRSIVVGTRLNPPLWRVGRSGRRRVAP